MTRAEYFRTLLDAAQLDLKALIVPELDIAEEREAAARDSYRVLSA
jgi:hypothetical protein